MIQPCLPQTANTPADDLVGALALYRWNGSTLVQQQMLVFDGATTVFPRAYGVCGLRIGDVIPGNGTDELVVTTMDGHMLVHAISASGTIDPNVPPLYSAQFAGALGMYNSIEIGDFDDDGKVDFYVAVIRPAEVRAAMRTSPAGSPAPRLGFRIRANWAAAPPRRFEQVALRIM